MKSAASLLETSLEEDSKVFFYSKPNLPKLPLNEKKYCTKSTYNVWFTLLKSVFGDIVITDSSSFV